MEERYLRIGDKIKVDNPYISSFIVEIERVTLTQAISKPINEQGVRYKFKLHVALDGSCIKLPRIKWTTTQYILLNE